MHDSIAKELKNWIFNINFLWTDGIIPVLKNALLEINRPPMLCIIDHERNYE